MHRKLTPEQRSEIPKKAVRACWKTGEGFLTNAATLYAPVFWPSARTSSQRHAAIRSPPYVSGRAYW